MMRDITNLRKAVDCKAMCESIVCYQKAKSPEEFLESNGRYLGDYVEVLGKETVLAIMKDVVDNVVEIVEDVHTDSEGCTYNSIKFKDGYQEARYLESALYEIWDKIVGYKKQ